MVMTDPIAKELLKEYFVPMPNQGLNDQDIDALLEFFTFNDKEINVITSYSIHYTKLYDQAQAAPELDHRAAHEPFDRAGGERL